MPSLRPTQRLGALTSRRRCGLLAAALLFAVRLTCPRPQPQQRCRPPHPGLWRPHLETHEAGWACCAVFLESCQSRKARNKKTLVIFLPYDAAPHFETLSHRNSQQNKERRPLSTLKTGITRRHSFDVRGVRNFYRGRRKDYPCLRGRSRRSATSGGCSILLSLFS